VKQQEAFGQFLRDLRNEKGLSQQQLAELLFVTRKTVGNWELGNRMPDISMLSRLADCLDVESYILLDALRQPGEPPRVIVVEDAPVILKGLIRTIREELPDIEVSGFRTAAQALEYAHTNRISVAFLDIELSGENGIDLAKDLKEIEPNVIDLSRFP
jgi:transcriptional regulator with XRE-family HTH domain